MKSQKLRRTILFLSFFLLPVTLNYFSPALVILGGFEGILSGSHIIWSLMLVSSLFIGRAWCSYICPYGGLQMAADKVINKKFVNVKHLRIIKYVIGGIWLGFIIYAIISGTSLKGINFFYNTESYVSTDSVIGLIRYYFIAGILLVISLILGKRGMCHYLCPMALLNMIGTKASRVLNIPSLHLEARKDKCTSCGQCSKTCPMSLNIMEMVQKGTMDNVECIHCGECSAACRFGALNRTFGCRSRAASSMDGRGLLKISGVKHILGFFK